MTLDEAIKYYEEAANNCEDGASHCDLTDYTERHIASIEGESANKYRQLAEWLKELKESRIVLDILGQFLTDSGIDVCCEDLPMIDDYCEKYCDNQKPLCWYRWAKMKASEVNTDEDSD